MIKTTLWVWCAVALLAGIGYVWFSRPGVVVSVFMIGLPLVLALWVGFAMSQEQGV